MNLQTKEEVKAKAKEWLLATDYAVLSDVQIDNKDEFLLFRKTMRELVTQDISSFYFDENFFPKPKWTVVEATPE